MRKPACLEIIARSYNGIPNWSSYHKRGIDCAEKEMLKNRTIADHHRKPSGGFVCSGFEDSRGRAPNGATLKETKLLNFHEPEPNSQSSANPLLRNRHFLPTKPFRSSQSFGARLPAKVC